MRISCVLETDPFYILNNRHKLTDRGHTLSLFLWIICVIITSIYHTLFSVCPVLLYKVKTQYAHFRLHTNYFLFPWKIPQEISRRSMLINYWRQYLPHQTYVHTSFHRGSGLTWNRTCNISISIIFDICTYCVFTLYDTKSVVYN